MLIIGFLILGTLLTLGFLMYTGKSVNINVTHTHVVHQNPVKTEQPEVEPVEKQMTSMVEAINKLVNGEDFYGERE